MGQKPSCPSSQLSWPPSSGLCHTKVNKEHSRAAPLPLPRVPPIPGALRSLLPHVQAVKK